MVTRCGVLGFPVAHSLSPTLHRAAYDELGLEDWRYDSFKIPSGMTSAFVRGLGPDWRGISVTMPLKREALDLADTASDRATLARGANTLVLTDGAIHADNTDLPGATLALQERTDAPLRRAVVLGAGATGVSTALALCDLGVDEVLLLARNEANAELAAEDVRRHASSPRVLVGPLEGGVLDHDIVVSTVPPPAQGPELLERCTEVAVVFEVLYDPWPTPLAAAALARGATLVTGLDLLVHQAALQVTAFTGRPAPLAHMRAAGEAALAARVGGSAGPGPA